MLLSEIRTNKANPRYIKDDNFKKLVASIKEFEKMMSLRPIIVDSDGEILGGNMRFRALKHLNYTEVPNEWIKVAKGLTDAEKRRFIIEDNVGFGEWDYETLANEWDADELNAWGLDISDFEALADEGVEEKEIRGKLVDSFIVPPFSVLDTRAGYWQERKKHWNELIGDNAESRENKLSTGKLMTAINNGTSILDPVVAELANLWFGMDKMNTFDPFAGDSVFGYVTDALGHTFTGIELRKEQVDLNNERLKGAKSKYICDDGRNVLKHLKPNSQDLLFSCPPYFDLEIYSDLSNDASNQKEYKDFIQILDDAFTASLKVLKKNRFIFIVVGDVRNKIGFYHLFVDDIKSIFKRSDVGLLNEMIIIDSIGTLPQRVGRYMKGRKIGKTHQNILVFYNGDPREIKNNFKQIDFKRLEEEEE